MPITNTNANPNPAQPPNDRDAALLARLNALRPTPVSLSTSTSPFLPTSTPNKPPGRDVDPVTALLRRTAAETAAEEKVESDLAARFARLVRGGGHNRAGDGGGSLSGGGLGGLKQSEEDNGEVQDVDEDAIRINTKAEDEKSLDELLAELGEDSAQWTELEHQKRDVVYRTGDLLGEARKALKDATATRREEEESCDMNLRKTYPRQVETKGGLENDGDEQLQQTKKDVNRDVYQDVDAQRRVDHEQEELETEAMIRRALEAAKFDRLGKQDYELGAHGNEHDHNDSTDDSDDSKDDGNRKQKLKASAESHAVKTDEDMNDDDDDDDEEPSSLFTLPSAPTDLPSTPTSLPRVPTTSNNTASSTSTTTDPFSFLPSTPTSTPSRLPPSTVTTRQNPNNRTTTRNLPTYTSDDIATWCCICNEDATIKCLGCDGDLYCAECWAEGHTGKGAGLEERSHRAVEFVKPVKGVGKVVGRRRRVGVGG